MAEKRFIKGLFKDTSPMDQPAGSWRYARNMILNETDGAVSNEGGTEHAGQLGDISVNSVYTGVGDQTLKAVGKIEVNDDKVVLFLLDEVQQNKASHAIHSCEIGIWENNDYRCLYKPEVPTARNEGLTNSQLNFNTSNPIEGTFKINPKEDLIVYWTDDLNPPRAFNISRQERWLENNPPYPDAVKSLYGIDAANSHEDHINLLNLFPHSGPVPHIEIHDVYWVDRPFQKSVNTGGGLLTGVYYLALAYIDDDFVSTNFLTVSNPVSIVEDYDHTRPRNKKDGAKHGTQTTKAIKWRVDNLNTDYKYLSPVIIRKMGDATEAFKLNVVEVNPDKNGRIEVVFSGLEGFTPSSVEDVIIDTISYERAKTINQLDGVLYLGNLKDKTDLGYQKYANAIKFKSKTKKLEKFDTFYATLDNLTTGWGNTEVDLFGTNVQDVRASQSYRYIPNIVDWKGYQRDEVYAFYIAFILKDGSMSYAYHIPGRETLSTQYTIDEAANNSSDFPGFNIKENSLLTKLGNENLLPGSDDFDNPPNAASVTSDIYKDLQSLSPAYAKNFHFFDSSHLVGANNMNYWENATETYPTTSEYEVWDEFTYIDSAGVTQGRAGSLQGENVRHHHFPSNANIGKGLFNFDFDPSSDHYLKSGHLCDTQSYTGPLSPRPWRVAFKAYIEYKEGPYNTNSGASVSCSTGSFSTEACDIDHADLTAQSGITKAYNNGFVANCKKKSPSINITNDHANPAHSYDQIDGYTDVISFNDKYPFDDPAAVDEYNPHLPGITNPAFFTATASPGVVTADQALAHDILWRGSYFESDQDLELRMRVQLSAVADHDDNEDCDARVYYKIKRKAGGWDQGQLGTLDDNEGRWCGCLPYQGETNFGTMCHDFRNGSSHMVSPILNLKMGDKVYIMFHAGTHHVLYPKTEHIKIPYSSKCDMYGSGNTDMWNAKRHAFQGEVIFEVESPNEPFDSEMLSDVKVRHSVNALGFTLEDVKVPKSIADQVQGFRIYYAKRGHSDKTILGQSPSIPMKPDKAIIGICKQALASANADDGAWIMQTESDTPQDILRKEPFAGWNVHYPEYDYIYRGSEDGMATYQPHGHKYFSYYDFHLLRTKNSLAGATHIKPQYYVDNFAWQPATVSQPKKMVSKLTENTTTSPPIKSITEEWGWNTSYNCYGEGVKTAMFIGCHYYPYQAANNAGWTTDRRQFSTPLLLNQKSVSYLRGDSIFKAEALGFGGTVVNEGGDSTIIYGLRDRHERYAYRPSLSSGCHEWSFYGEWTRHNPFYLVGNPLDRITVGSALTSIETCDRKSYVNIDNLCSFKTDVYKSIDDQELVWTGFEVLGQDLNNFIFWDEESIKKLPAAPGNPSRGDKFTFTYKNRSGNFNEDNSGNPIEYSADYKILTLQSEIQRDTNGDKVDEDEGRFHIFGGDTFICRYGFASGYAPRDSEQTSTPQRALHYHIVETPDNINFRHIESDESLYFPGTSAHEMLKQFTGKDYNHQDNIKYNDNYSAVNNIRPAFPLPLRESKQDIFSTRTHRSVRTDPTSVIDNYRIFKANQFKDLPKNRGELWKLSTFNNLLYFHMEESLYAAKGKQSMQMKDGSEAFVGSGDIFQQEPDELIQTDGGYGGTQSQSAAITTRFGYFFVDAKSNKVFLMKDKLLEISAIGMETWFKDNLPFTLADYGYGNCVADNPIQGTGFHSVYDAKHKRIILTKRELIPTQAFIAGFDISGGTFCGGNILGIIRFHSDDCQFKKWTRFKDNTCGWDPLSMDCANSQYFTCAGWTISYYPELGVWGSFHDYVPYLYFKTTTDYYSLTDKHQRPVWCTNVMINADLCNQQSTPATWQGTSFGNAAIWKHNSSTRGVLYEENKSNFVPNAQFEDELTYYPFEFEVIHNETKSRDSILASFNYTLETFNSNNVSVLEHGFTRFYLYNTFQISADTQTPNHITGTMELSGTNLEYLVNVRRIGNNWKINNFRDMASTAVSTNNYYMSTNTNIIGGINTGTVTTSSTQEMFTISGMEENINASYVNMSKPWDERKKFIDKWVGIRLIYDNISNNLLNLYSTDVVTRKIHR